jgi:hypothetical protein
MLALTPANPAARKTWLRFAFGTGGISAVMAVVKQMFPAEILQRFPEYDTFVYAALAISLISALLLYAINKVITVSLAQLGSITGLLYIGYALFGIFSGSLVPVFAVLMILTMAVMILVFGESLLHYKHEHAYADMVFGLIFLSAAIFMCAYPLYILIRQVPGA